MEIGVISALRRADEEAIFEGPRQFGLKTCQLVNFWDGSLWTDELAAKIVKQSSDSGVYASAVWAGWPGPAEWNFTGGPVTLGLVPVEYRTERIAALKQSADFAKKIGVPAIITHCGFIPENMTDPLYDGVVQAIGEVAQYCESLGLEFWFETGQETPVVLLRTIERLGTGNLGINLDPANLLMYGKGNPLDALDVFGQYVRNVHVKDGMCPSNGDELGCEVQVGQGKVRWPEFIKRLKKIGFDGELIIEREIEQGPEQNRDILQTIENLRRWLNA
ncbi:MAG: TIM barrel protein [Actinobacteria bacterium]|nr:TIM barrel protein [Actinomycetota bacterium]